MLVKLRLFSFSRSYIMTADTASVLMLERRERSTSSAAPLNRGKTDVSVKWGASLETESGVKPLILSSRSGNISRSRGTGWGSRLPKVIRTSTVGTDEETNGSLLNLRKLVIDCKECSLYIYCTCCQHWISL